MTALPSPSPTYDPQNEAELRRTLEQALTQLSTASHDSSSTSGSGTAGLIPIWTGTGTTLGNSSMSESGGVVNFGARPTVGAESMAYVSQLFTQAMADARYSLLGHTHTTSQITDFTTAGDARWITLATADSRYLKLTGGTLSGALSGTTGSFSGDVDANDFVLSGGGSGSGPGAAFFSVSDEGTLLASSVTSMNFVGPGVVASASGGAITVTVNGAVTSVFGRTGAVVAASGDYNWSQVSGGHPTTIAGYGITDFNSLGDARWLGLAATAAAATKLATARTIAGVSFDGTVNIAIPFANLASLPTTIGGYGITDFNALGDARYLQLAGGTLTGDLYFGTYGRLNAASTGLSILTPAGAAWGMRAKWGLFSDTYSDESLVPALGIYAKGNMKAADFVLA